jgi:hypothetical protein
MALSDDEDLSARSGSDGNLSARTSSPRKADDPGAIGKTHSQRSLAPPKQSHRRKKSIAHVWTTPKPEEEQLEALAALIAKLDQGQTYGGLLKDLLNNVLRRDGHVMVPGDSIGLVVEQAMEASSEREQPPEGWAESNLPQQSDPKTVSPLILDVLQHLADSSDTTRGQLIGQILWRHKKQIKVVDLTEYATHFDDLSWVADAALFQQVKAVFYLFTEDAGSVGHMHLREFLKTVHLASMNPVLREHIMQNDVDRLFYTASHAHVSDKSPDVITINYSEFLKLLMKLAEASNVHPYMLVLAIAVHADEIRTSLESKGTLTPEYIKQFFH